jgi:hypothetical protein
MPRPRKNPEDVKWEQPKSDEWRVYFAAALGGLIARGGLSEDQMIKTAKQYAEAAYKEVSK